MVVGVMLHFGMTAVLDGISLFAPVVLVGYLAFLDDGPPVADPAPRPRRVEVALACAYLAMVVFVPGRIYVPPMRPWHLLAHMDHLPWTYSMFSQSDHVDSVEVGYLDREGKRHEVQPVGRMVEATSDGELDAMARAVFREFPEAEEVRVCVRWTVNHRRGLEKQLTARRGRPAVLDVRERN